MKYKQLIIGIVVGLIAGFLLAWRFQNLIPSTDNYSVQIMNQAVAIKVNKRTGETWEYSSGNRAWKPIATSN